jgi:hypothetical protein
VNLTALPASWPTSIRDIGNDSPSGIFNGTPLTNRTEIAGYDFSAVKRAREAFRGCTSINFPVDNWEFPMLWEARDMFRDTAFNQRLDNGNFGLVSDFRSAFNGTGCNNDSPKNWDGRSVTLASSMFPTMDTAVYDAILIGIAAWGAELKSTVTFGAGSSKYSAGAAADARTYLVSTKGWTVNDGGPV